MVELITASPYRLLALQPCFFVTERKGAALELSSYVWGGPEEQKHNQCKSTNVAAGRFPPSLALARYPVPGWLLRVWDRVASAAEARSPRFTCCTGGDDPQTTRYLSSAHQKERNAVSLFHGNAGAKPAAADVIGGSPSAVTYASVWNQPLARKKQEKKKKQKKQKYLFRWLGHGTLGRIRGATGDEPEKGG